MDSIPGWATEIEHASWCSQKVEKKKRELEIPGGPVTKTPYSQCRGPGSIPGQGVRSHMLQLRVSMPQSKILHTAMEIDDLESHN